MTKRKKRKSGKKKGVRKEPFSLFRFFWDFKAEIITIICIMIGVRIVASLGKSKEGVDEVDTSLAAVSVEQTALWQKQYPSGYKIVAIVDETVVHTEQDTLPEDLKINWRNITVDVIPANPLTQSDEKLQLNVPIVSYAPVNVYNLNVSAVLSRHKREKVGLARFGWHNLMVEIIGDDGNQILCLIGFQ